jgi:hypothetical protein
MPKYRLHDAEGNDMGEMLLGDVPFRPGDEIFLGPGRKLRVLDVVPLEEEDESPFVAMLRVEAA